ncbi:MAG: hypothetical protein PUD16_09050, partial [bacterium]|nr:hypothetical protein [bacterium]
VRFIVLDTNWVHTANGLIDLAYEKSSLYPGSKQRYLSQVQLAWLQQTLRTSAEPCVLLSHASLVDPLCGIHNPQALAEVLDGCAGKVILALNGHSHVDGMTRRRDTAFVNINSASYHWVGVAYAAVHYSRQLCSLYPQMANTVPYYHPLYAVVTIADGAIRIDGTQSCFVGPSPQALGLPAEENDYPPTPCISHRLISLP